MKLFPLALVASMILTVPAVHALGSSIFGFRPGEIDPSTGNPLQMPKTFRELRDNQLAKDRNEDLFPRNLHSFNITRMLHSRADGSILNLRLGEYRSPEYNATIPFSIQFKSVKRAQFFRETFGERTDRAIIMGFFVDDADKPLESAAFKESDLIVGVWTLETNGREQDQPVMNLSDYLDKQVP